MIIYTTIAALWKATKKQQILKEHVASAPIPRPSRKCPGCCEARADKLVVQSTPNQDTPAMDASTVPLLGIDVWEHAYYLKHQSRRADYIKDWWHVVSWPEVARRYEAARAATGKAEL
mmetsp:Transcript_5951/g.19603  ORF Transcript_5951/g.19603 Transcript_5951/m.19603 type:complete len:118 (+) Transcript_5951:26-379(+)